MTGEDGVRGLAAIDRSLKEVSAVEIPLINVGKGTDANSGTLKPE